MTDSKASISIANLLDRDNKELYNKSLSKMNIGYTNIGIQSDGIIERFCECFKTTDRHWLDKFENRNINNLVFDFSKHCIKVDKCQTIYCYFCGTLNKKKNREGYIVNIQDLTLKPFFHASCQCSGLYYQKISNTEHKYINNVHINKIHIILDYRFNRINVTTFYNTVEAF